MKWVSRHRIFSLIVVLAIPGLAAAMMRLPEDNEENAKVVDPKSVPQAAREALSKFAAGHDIERIERDDQGGHVLFEALWKVDGKEHEATVTATGVLVELEEAAALETLPDDVRQQLNRHFKDAKDMKFERKLIAAYEIEGTINGKEHQRLMAPTGAEIKIQTDDDDDDDDDDYSDDDDNDDDRR